MAEIRLNMSVIGLDSIDRSVKTHICLAGGPIHRRVLVPPAVVVRSLKSAIQRERGFAPEPRWRAPSHTIFHAASLSRRPKPPPTRL